MGKKISATYTKANSCLTRVKTWGSISSHGLEGIMYWQLSKRLHLLRGYSVVFLKWSLLPPTPNHSLSFCISSWTEWSWTWSSPEESQGWLGKWADDTQKLCSKHSHFPPSLLPSCCSFQGLPSTSACLLWLEAPPKPYAFYGNFLIPIKLIQWAVKSWLIWWQERAECQVTRLS